MEIKKLPVTKYLKRTDSNIYYLQEFFSKNSFFLEAFIEHDKLSYLDDYSKFFFLFKLREQFLDSYENYIEAYKLHESSVFYVLFSIPEFSTGVNVFQYDLDDESDSIIYINLFLQIEMFKIIDRIIYSHPQLYNYLLGVLTIEELKTPMFLSNPNLLLISAFIIEPYNLYKIVNNDFELQKVDLENDFLRKFDVFPLIELLKNFDNNIYERTGRKYVRNYNPFYYKKEIHNIPVKDCNIHEFIEENRLLFSFDWENLPKYEIDTSFSICEKKLCFCLNEGLDYDLGEKIYQDFQIFSTPSNFLYEKIGIKNEDVVKKNSLKKIENQQDDFLLSTILRKKMIIKSSNELAYRLIEKYIELNKEIQDEKIKNGFKKLFDFLTNPEIKEIPVIENVNLKKAKHLLSFFITMKTEISVFEFKNIEDLKYLILYITGNIHSINNQQLRQVHRLPKFKIANEIKNKLRSEVSEGFLK